MSKNVKNVKNESTLNLLNLLNGILRTINSRKKIKMLEFNPYSKSNSNNAPKRLKESECLSPSTRTLLKGMIKCFEIQWKMND